MFFCEESLRKINEKDVELFRNGSAHESVDYFETKKYFRRRKTRIFMSKTSIGRQTGLVL